MLDRASTFADDEIIALLQTKYVPVVANASHHGWLKDDESEFYRKVVFQRADVKKGNAHQGFYIFSPDGKMVEGWNNRDPDKVKRLLKQSLASYRSPSQVETLKREKDRRFVGTLPPGAVVVDVFSKITQADWPPYRDQWDERFGKMFRESTGRDHLWITQPEITRLARGEFPESLARRIGRYHLVDNTRGEPPFWKSNEVRASKSKVAPDRGALRVESQMTLVTNKGDRGYDADLFGYVETKAGKLTRFDLVARGQYWGHGQYTGENAPRGKFTLAIVFTLANPKAEATKVLPQGCNDWPEYLKE